MLGPPGTGKSMLAARLPGILPPMSEAEALESAAVLVAGEHRLRCRVLDRTRPFALRITAHRPRRWSAAACRRARAKSRWRTTACCSSTSCPSSRAMRSKRCASRSNREASRSRALPGTRPIPARFQLVAAMNPCACGHLGDPSGKCRCTPDQVARYRGKVSGPLLDRIDLKIEVPRPRESEMMERAEGESSAVVRSRVCAARERQVMRVRASRMRGCSRERPCAIAGSIATRKISSSRRLRGSRFPRAAITACCASRARSRTWTRAAKSLPRTSRKRFSTGGWTPASRTGLFAIDPVEHFLPVDPVAEVGSAAQLVSYAKGRDGHDQVRACTAEDNGPAGVARARAAAAVTVALRLQVVAVGPCVAVEIYERRLRHQPLAERYVGEFSCAHSRATSSRSRSR